MAVLLYIIFGFKLGEPVGGLDISDELPWEAMSVDS